MERMRIIDMHCDTIERLYRVEQNRRRKESFHGYRENLRKNHGHLDLERMKRSGYFMQNFALFVDVERWMEPWEGLIELYQYYCREMKENEDMITPVRSYKDVKSALQNGRMCALLTVEEGGVCCGELRRLRELYARGVRMMTLTWNYENELGVPALLKKCKKEGNRGLTNLGKEFVAEMETLGIIPDVSHLSDEGFYDVLEITQKPIVASHSNARTVCPHERNLTDAMIRRIAERGGCVGLNYYEEFLILDSPNDKKRVSSVEMLVKHAHHIVNVGGVEVLGLGSDFDGIPTNSQILGVENIELIWHTMKKNGFSESKLDKIFFENVLRVYREWL